MNIKALLKSLLLRKFTTGLLIMQLAITLGLLVNSAILALDTQGKLAKNTGLALDNTLLVSLHPTSGSYKDLDYFRSIVREDMTQINRMQGVNAVSVTNQLPIRSRGMLGNVYDMENPEQDQTDRYLKDAKINLVDENFAAAMNLTVVEGRFFNESDELPYDSNERNPVVITESLKKTLYGDGSAIGRDTNQGRVIGVVKDTMLNPLSPRDKQYGVYINTQRKYIFTGRYYVLNVAPGQMELVKKQVSDVILGVQPERDIFNIFTMEEHFKRFYRDDQGLADLFTLLCALMLLVTAISSYAYSQFHISRQKKFIGIRRALGATRKDILMHVLTENWLVYTIGCMLGVAVAIGFNILLSQHISLSKPDMFLSLTTMLVIFGSGTLATWIPAYQTSKIPPVIATKTV